MNIVNSLTLSRIVLTPLIVILFDISHKIGNSFLSLVIDIVVLVLVGYAELSDFLDGKIARAKNIVSDFGKVFDPFSDMFMHLSFLVIFVFRGYVDVYVLFLCLWRELLMVLVRNISSKEGKALAANIFGKIKTFALAILSLLVCLLRLLTDLGIKFNTSIITKPCGWICAFLSVMSVVIYFYQNRSILAKIIKNS